MNPAARHPRGVDDDFLFVCLIGSLGVAT